MKYNVYALYLIPEDRVVYVGSTDRNPLMRYYEHTISTPEIRLLSEQYGYDSFMIYTLAETDDLQEAYEQEEYYTKYYEQFFTLVNKCYADKTMSKHTKEEMRAHYDRTLGPWIKEHGSWIKGKSVSDKERERLRTLNIGRKHSDEVKQHMRDASGVANAVYCIETDTIYRSAEEAHVVLGVDSSSVIKNCKGIRKSVNGYHFQYACLDQVKHLHSGKPLSEEHKQKLRERSTSKFHTPESRQKMKEHCSNKRKVICLDTGEVFDSLADAANKYNILSQNIYHCCQHMHQTSGGLRWAYYDEVNFNY